MRKSAKIITALSVAGLAVVAGSAFTGTGLSTSGSASSAQFIGGTVSQAVTGATLSTLEYGFTDTTKTAVDQVTLTFGEGADGKAVSVALTGGTAAEFSCTPVDATSNQSVCTAAADTSQTGVTSASVTVS